MLWTNVGSVVEFQRCLVLKIKIFGQESTFFKTLPQEYVDSWPKKYFLGPTIFEIPQPN